jgi:condensin-2 complex subunit D3
MTDCFEDDSPNVRRQTLHILTRLVVEDYVKMRPELFFRYVWAITDPITAVATFAQCCLFDVILEKCNGLISTNFLDQLYHFASECYSLKRRREGIDLLISRLSDVEVFNLVDAIFKRLLKKYIEEELDVKKDEWILADGIYSLIRLEDKMKVAAETEIISEVEAEKLIESSRKMIAEIHNKMIQSILPILNDLHRILRSRNSAHQGELRQFYQRICAKNPGLLTELGRTEPILARELQDEMERAAEGERGEEGTAVPATPARKEVEFASELLSKIASTPRSLLVSPMSQAGKYMSPRRLIEARQEFGTPPHGGELD